MNYKNNTVRELQDFINQHPQMSLGEIFYTISRELKITNKSEFLEKEDEEMYTAVNKAKETEKEYA